MPAVKTNTTSLSYTRETAPGTPGTIWKLLEPNTIEQYGAEIATVSRQPISTNRQREAGTITDLDSASEWEADLTMDSVKDFIEAFMFAAFTSVKSWGPLVTDQVTATDSNSYTVDAGGALAQRTLVYARGWVNAANNGLKMVDAGATGTDVPITGGGLTTETAPVEAQLEVAGFRTAAGDLDVNAQGNLTSTSLNFTTLGLTVGQFIWIGGSAALNKFTNAANNGLARVVAIAANLLTIDKKTQAFVTEVNTTQEVDILFGRFVRNVPVTHGNYLERTFHLEETYPNLMTGPVNGYEYSKGNYANQLSLQLQLADKAIGTFGFVGTDVEAITSSRKTGAATPVLPIETTALNTTADFIRLRITDIAQANITTFFKSMSLVINNNVSPEKTLARLGAAFVNVGNFFVDLETQVLFESEVVVNAIRANTTVAMDFALKNSDGGLAIDIPAMKLGGGGKDFVLNEIVKLNITGPAHRDPTLNYSMSVSLFPFLP